MPRLSSAETPAAVLDLLERVAGRLPGATHTITPGGVQAGNWWLDFRQEEHSATVEWRPQLGFGIYDSTGEEAYGSGPREIFRDAEMAARRLGQLLSAKAHGQSWLAEVRELHGVSQVEVARRLHIRQANISKLEKRARVQLATMIRVVSALGGNIEIRARFAGADFPLDLSTLAPAPRPPATSRKAAPRARRKAAAR